MKILLSVTGARYSYDLPLRCSATSPGFVVRLPLAAAGVAEVKGRRHSAAAPALKILIVEDNDDSRRMLSNILQLDGHEVQVASNGEEGLSAIQRERPAVAVVDIGLPTLNGYEVAAECVVRTRGKAFIWWC